jgi:HK97 family phage major capsid protein
MAVAEAIKNKATELETLKNNVKTEYARIEQLGEKATGEDRQKLNDMIEAGQKVRAELKSLNDLDELTKAEPSTEGQKAVEKPGVAVGEKSWGQRVVDSNEYKNAPSSGGEKRDLPPVNVGGFKDFIGKNAQLKAIYGGTDATGGVAVVNDRRLDILDIARQRPRSVLDLVNQSTTNSDLVEYIIQDARTNAAAVVSEYTGGNFGLKPESNMTFDIKTAAVKTIATWVAVSRQILNDAPRLRQLIDNELTYMVELILENTLVTDMLAWTGIQSRVHATSGARFDAADNIADSLRRAITDLYLEFYQPDGIILNPAQGETLELLKDDNNQYMRVYDSATMRLWRVPVVETAAMTAGTALVGNFKLGVTVWDREQTQILTGQPSDYFLRNAFAILAELRAAWAVTRPLALEKVTGL